jgi:hypothetical protein
LAAFPWVERLYSRPGSDWRGASQVILSNIGAHDGVAAPTVGRQLLFYAPELERRLGARPDLRIDAVPYHLLYAERAWIVVPRTVQMRPRWQAVAAFLGSRVVIDLSPSPDPSVYYVTSGIGRSATYGEVSYFDLPVSVLAGTALVHDWLVEIGPTRRVAGAIRALIADQGGWRPHPSLRRAVELLRRHERKELADALAAAIAARGMGD